MNTKRKGSNWAFFIPYIILIIIMLAVIYSCSGSKEKATAINMNAESFLTLVDDTEKGRGTTCNDKSGNVCTIDLATMNVTYSPTSTNIYEFKGTFKETNVENATKLYSFSFKTDSNMGDEILLILRSNDVKLVIIDPNESSWILVILSNVLPVLIIGLILFLLIRYLSKANQDAASRGMEFGKSTAKEKKDITTKFKDVAGCDEEKEEMQELVEYLKKPEQFKAMGARIPKGVILKGPPGTGKTLLARAVAGEAGVPFYYISGSDFVEMFVGVGASRVRDMFRKAKSHAPSILFIDEIDAVGRQRGAGLGGGNDEREQTLNQLLVELDGFGENTGVLVIAATNRSDVLDPALLRPGRFDRQITVSLPDKRGREAILKVHARNKKVDNSVDFTNIAARTPGFSGAQLENVLNEAAILAVRASRNVIITEDIDEAIDRVIGGPAKKSRIYTPHEKKLVAYHEAGHAIIGLTLPHAGVVQKVTIIPRGEAGGYNLMTPEEETYYSTKSELLEIIVMGLGGRTAEEVFFDDITNGAHNDIEKATRIARLMVTEFGMSDLGPIQYEKNTGSVFLGRDYTSQERLSGETTSAIDRAVRDIIDKCHIRARQIIEENRGKIVLIAETLLIEETLTNEEIVYLVKNGKMPEVVKKDDNNPFTNPDAFANTTNPFGHKDDKQGTN